jgi:hypothetical protein
VKTGDDAFADAVRAVLLTDAQARGAAVVYHNIPGILLAGASSQKRRTTAPGVGEH